MDTELPEEIISKRREIANLIKLVKLEIADAIILGSVSGVPKPNRFEESPEQLTERVNQWLVLLVGFFLSKPGYRELVAGQTIFEFDRPELNHKENDANLIEAAKVLTLEIENVFNNHNKELLDPLRKGLQDVFFGIGTESKEYIDTLLIGDCLMAEIAGISIDMTRREGLGFSSFPLNARTPIQLDKTIKSLGEKKYKAIFFSPFSHARGAELEALLNIKYLVSKTKTIEDLAQKVIDQTSALIQYLVNSFDCPIYIHTAGLVARGDTRLKSIIRGSLLKRQTNIAKKRINTWLNDYVVALNQSLGKNIQLIDENEIVKSMPNGQAGLLMHNSNFQHATYLSFALAKEYAARINMIARLKGKKLVICDLDNTLWDGVIGEGSVTHFEERQKDLKRLKYNSGVVLSIASKNDPVNVKFNKDLLTDKDFVSPQINWGLKTKSIEKICENLNLQKRHTVFIDDRSDELSLVKNKYPDIDVLDATDQKSWDQISLWADLVEGSSDIDRTEMYKEKASRDAFVESISEVGVDQAEEEFLKELKFKINVRQATGSDIKRAAELINRTNQWNLCGSRTSEAELKKILANEASLVLIASAEDRFGKMGDICVAVAENKEIETIISMFVLSCRVFGYGVETSMIRYIEQSVRSNGASKRLIGRYVATNQNSLCKNMYLENGFVVKGENDFVLTL